jgi:hypothetical protein
MQISPTPRTPSLYTKKLLFTYQGWAQIKLILGGALTLVGLPMFFLCAFVLSEEFSTWQGALGVEANLIYAEKDLAEASVGELRYEVRYQYQQDDKTYEGSASLSVSKGNEMFIGKPISIKASQTVPGASRLPGIDAYSGPLILLLVMGLPFSFFGLRFLLTTFLEMRRRRKAYTYGTPITATVLSAGDDLNTSINYVHPFRVTWQFEVNGKLYQGDFSSMNKAALAALVTSKALLVVYLPEQPTHNTLYLP